MMRFLSNAQKVSARMVEGKGIPPTTKESDKTLKKEQHVQGGFLRLHVGGDVNIRSNKSFNPHIKHILPAIQTTPATPRLKASVPSETFGRALGNRVGVWGGGDGS